MKKFFVTLAALVAITGISSCSDDDVALFVDGAKVFNGADATSATTHWESTGTSSIDLKIALYSDGTCEILVSGDVYDTTNLAREGRYDCTFVPTGVDSVDLMLTGESGPVTIELTDIEYDSLTDTWTMTLDYDDDGANVPVDLTLQLNECNMDDTIVTGAGCYTVLTDLYNGADEMLSTTHWESVGTSAVALKIAFYEDDTCEMLVSSPIYDTTNLAREGRYDCTVTALGSASVTLSVTGEAGAIAFSITSIVYDDMTDTWTATVDYADDSASEVPHDVTMDTNNCNIANTLVTGAGCQPS